MSTQEIWKDIPGYEGLYQVSNLGRIKSLCYKSNYRNEIILKLRKKQNGYFQVVLYKNGKPKDFSVHKLVAKTFINNPNDYPIINHKDENKQNNKVDNLEWCTHSYNNEYSLSKKINQYNKDNVFIKIWSSARKIERELLINHSDILKCCKGLYKQAGGFIWKFEGVL